MNWRIHIGMNKDKRVSACIAMVASSLILNSFTPIWAAENNTSVLTEEANEAQQDSSSMKTETPLEETEEEDKEHQEISSEDIEAEDKESQESSVVEENEEKPEIEESATAESVDVEKEETEITEGTELESTQEPVLEEETTETEKSVEEAKETEVETAETKKELSSEDSKLDSLEEYNREDIYELAMSMMEQDQQTKNSTSKFRAFSSVSYVDSFLQTIIPQAIEDSINSKILPSITIAQAALESAWGQSGLAIHANNLFGIKASDDWKGSVYKVKTWEVSPAVYDSKGNLIKAEFWYEVVAPFRKYESWLGSLRDHGLFFTSTEWRKNNYRYVVGEKDYRKAAQALLNAGYATDPGYANKLINIIETYDLAKYDKVPTINSSSYVQNKGWQNKSGNTVLLGTTGAGLQLQDMKFTSAGYEGIGVNYSALIDGVGWTGNISTGNSAGNAGTGKRMEAVKISLTGENAKNFDVLYRVHTQSFGWTGWAKNGQPAGKTGYGKRVEAVEVKIAWKGTVSGDSASSCFQSYTTPHVVYTPHVQSKGWSDPVKDGVLAGTTGIKKRLEAITVSLQNQPYSGSISYQTHVQSHGWVDTVSNGRISGTTDQHKRMEAIKVGLSGEMAKHFDVYYRTHIQTYGWTGWAKNGAPSGSEGLFKRMEAVEIVLVKKGGPAPGSTEKVFYK